MSRVDKAQHKIDDLTSTVRDDVAAQHEKGESDVDGEYVGRTAPAFDAEVAQSGAEARSEAARGSS